MKNYLRFLLMLLLFAPLAMQAQMTATFGTGTSETSTGGSAGAPMSYGGAYSWCQQIYRAAEFTAAGVPSGAIITSISFYNATGATTMSDIRTYMGHCTNDYFASTSSWVPYNTLTMVDSGDWVAPAGWFEIQLDQPFVWDGTSNVVVGVSFRGAHSDYNTNNPNCGYRYTTQSGSAHIRRYSTTLSSCDPTSTAAANSTSTARPNLRISYVIAGCSSSLAPTVTNIGSYTADLNWINFQQSISSWDIMYGEEGTFDTLSGGTTITGITDTFYTLSGLTSATTYAVYMKSYCSSEIGPWSMPRVFTTTAACPTPTNLTVTGFTADEATVSWSPGATETAWEVACVPHGTPVGSATPDYVYNSPYTFTNLSANTQYDIFVRADCGNGEHSYWAQVTMTTACTDLTTLPFVENFDSHVGSTATSVAASNLPNCWSNLNAGTSTSYSGYPIIYNSTTYSASGTNSLRFYTYTTAGTYDDQIAILPPIDLNTFSMNTLQVSFDVRALSTSYTFKLDVGIMTDPTNRNTFDTIQTLNITSTSYANYEIPFSQYLGTGKYIALRASQPTSGYNYGYVDNIRVEPIPACPKPINVTSSNVTTNSITLNWTEVGTATSWEVVYGPAGFTPGPTSGTTESVYALPHTITGLSASTLYDFYVRSDCGGGGDYSNYSVVHSVSTQCDYITALPLTDDFDSYSGSTATSVSVNNLPNCWSHYNVGTNTSYSGYPIIYSSSTYAASGTNAIRFYTYSPSGTYSDQVAILPPIDQTLYPMNTLQLSFDARDNSTSYPFNIQIGVMTDPMNINTFTLVSTVTTQSTTYANYEIPLNQYTGTGAFIAIRVPHPASGYNYGYVDNVVVDLIPSCPKPQSVHATNVSNNTVELGWTEVGTATSWVVEYGPHGFTPGNGTVEYASTNPHTIYNLTSSTSYDFYVKSDCGGTYSNNSTVLNITTACDALTQLPYTENFDTYGTGESAYPSCWGKINTYSSNRPYVNSTNYAGTGSLYFYAASGTYNIAVTPPFDATIPVNTLQANFMYRTSSTSDYMIVGVMSNPADASTFVPIDTIHPGSTASTWVEREVVFFNYTGTGQYIAFYNGKPSTTCYSYIDNLSIDLIPSCPKPQSVHATNVSTNTVELGWTEVGSATSWVVEYGPTGFTPGNGTTETATSNPHTITGLTASTTYDFYVKSDCNGTYSNNSTVLTVATSCDAILQLPYTENFDTYGTGESAYPNCWGKINTYSSNRPYVNSTHYAGVGSLYFYAASGTYNIAVTPPFDATIPINTLQANFMYRTSSSTADYLIVGVMSNPADASTFVPIDTIHPGSTASTWVEREVVFYNYTGTGQYIAFYNGKPSTTCYSYIDNLSIDLIPACPKPQSVHATNLTTTSIDLVWTEVGTATSWEIEYGPTGFTLGNGTTETATTTSYTITGLSASTTYDFYIKSDCGGTYSNYSTVLTVTTACDAITQLPFTEGFDNYGTATASAYPPCWTKYSTYTASTALPYCSATHYAGVGSLYLYVATSGTYNMAITPPFDVTIPINTLQATFMHRATNSTDRTIVGVMSNPTDPTTFVPVDTIYPSSTASTWVEREVVFSNYTGTGQYIVFRNEYTTTNCYTYVDNLVIDLIPACPHPQSVHANSVTTNSIELGWTEIGTATSWEIEYGPAGFTPGNGTTDYAYTNPHTISNLSASTTYDFYIRSDCGSGQYSNAAIFSASTACDAITQLPFSENFDSHAGTTSTSVSVNNLPNCWSYLNNGTNTSYTGYPIVYNSTSYVHSGVNVLRFYTGTGTYGDEMAILPPFDATLCPINTLQLSFYARALNTSYPFTLVVGVLTSPTNFTSFTPIDTLSITGTSHTLYDIPLSQYTGTGTYIGIMAPKPLSNMNYGYVDDILVDVIPTCPKPQNVHANTVTINSIELGWTEVGSATSWEVAYGAPGFSPDSTSATVVTATTNPFNVTGLNSTTTYEFYVRSLCGGTDVSNWSSALQASTTMTPEPLPYTADFSANDAWVLNNGSCTNYWRKGTVSGTPALFVTDNGSTPNYDGTSASAVAALKLFTVGTADTITISFNIMVDGESSFDYFKLFLAPPTQQFPAATSVASDHFGYNSYSTNAYNFYANGYGTQSSYPYILNKLTSTIQVTAKMPNPIANPDANSTALLALTWRNDPSVTYNPPATITNLTVTASSTAPVTCTAPTNVTASNIQQTSATITWTAGGTETAWELQYKTASASSWSNSINVTGTPSHNLTGLTAGTQYQVRVRAVCSATETSNWSATASFTTTQASVTPPTVTTNDATVITTNSAVLNGTVAAGSESITAQGFEWKATVGGSYAAVNATGTTMSYNLQGLTAGTGYTFRAFATTASGTTYGVEKTFTTTTEQPTCPSPTNVTASNVTETTASISWTQPDNTANSWDVLYKESAASSWYTATTSSNPYTLAGLTPETSYDVQIIAHCTNGQTSDPSATITFTTQPDGIDNYTLDNTVTVYPNPTTGLVQIKNEELRMENVEVYDVFGKLLNAMNVNDHTATLDLSGYAKGTYFVKVTTEKGVVTKRVVKQ